MSTPPHTLHPPDGLLPLAYPPAPQGVLGSWSAWLSLLSGLLLLGFCGFWLHRWRLRCKAAPPRAQSPQLAKNLALGRLLALRQSSSSQEVFLSELWACWALYVQASGLQLAYTLHEWPGLVASQPLSAKAATPLEALRACAPLWDAARFGVYTLCLQEREQLWQAFHDVIKAEVLDPLRVRHQEPKAMSKECGSRMPSEAFMLLLGFLKPAKHTVQKGGCHDVALGL